MSPKAAWTLIGPLTYRLGISQLECSSPSKLERTWEIVRPYALGPFDAFNAMMNTPQHILMGGGTPEEMKRIVEENVAYWKELFQKAGVKPE